GLQASRWLRTLRARTGARRGRGPGDRRGRGRRLQRPRPRRRRGGDRRPAPPPPRFLHALATTASTGTSPWAAAIVDLAAPRALHAGAQGACRGG
ncbi:Os04g0630551, partial [Oryza sativa Japonica Group]